MDLDTSVFPTREDALAYALVGADPGDILTVCRGDWEKCPDGQVCPMCARITVTKGMTLVDLLGRVEANRA